MQLRVFLHEALHEDSRLIGIQARSQVGGRQLLGGGPDLLHGLVLRGQGVPVRDHVEGLALVLEAGEVVEGPHEVADVLGTGGLDAGKDALHRI